MFFLSHWCVWSFFAPLELLGEFQTKLCPLDTILLKVSPKNSEENERYVRVAKREGEARYAHTKVDSEL